MAYPQQLFDLKNDPYELNNQVDEPACLPTIADLGQRLLRWLAQTDDPFFGLMLGGISESQQQTLRGKMAD